MLDKPTAATLAAALATTALVATPATGQDDMREMQSRNDAAMAESVSAERMMSGEVSRAFRSMGEVTDLILDPAGQKVEYILYETPTIARIYGGEDGFVRWDNITIERGIGSGLDLRIDDEASAQAKDELTITRSQAGKRLVSDILEGELMFADGQRREVEDVLFNPETGMLTHFVTEMDADSLYTKDRRRIPASMVRYDEGRDMWMIAQPTTYAWEAWVL